MKKSEESATSLREDKPTSGLYAEVYRGQILDRGDEDDAVAHIGSDWHVGKLRFRKHIDDAYRLGGGAGKSTDDYAVIDPRNPSKRS